MTTNDSSENVPDSTGDPQTSVGAHGVSNSAQLPCIVRGDALVPQCVDGETQTETELPATEEENMDAVVPMVRV